MAVNWLEGVNTNAYGMSMTPTDNLQVQEFESGAKRTWLKNSKTKKQFSFMLSLKDDGSNSEYKRFLAWYDDVLLSGSQSFYFPDLITHSGLTEYKMTEQFTAKGQLWKEISITVEEV